MKRRLAGFTLIESIIVIIVMAIAMLTIVYFLSPQITRSGDPHYQTRAAGLGQSLMSQVLARNFDENSNGLGGVVRCSSADVGTILCSESSTFGPDANMDDVDDYHGCWTTSSATPSCPNDLNTLLSNPVIDSLYSNFQVDIEVSYLDACDPTLPSSCPKMLKKIDMTITAGKQMPFTLTAYKGNY